MSAALLAGRSRMVGNPGLEPGTSRSQTECSSQLSQFPSHIIQLINIHFFVQRHFRARGTRWVHYYLVCLRQNPIEPVPENKVYVRMPALRSFLALRSFSEVESEGGSQFPSHRMQLINIHFSRRVCNCHPEAKGRRIWILHSAVGGTQNDIKHTAIFFTAWPEEPLFNDCDSFLTAKQNTW